MQQIYFTKRAFLALIQRESELCLLILILILEELVGGTELGNCLD